MASNAAARLLKDVQLKGAKYQEMSALFAAFTNKVEKLTEGTYKVPGLVVEPHLTEAYLRVNFSGRTYKFCFDIAFNNENQIRGRLRVLMHDFSTPDRSQLVTQCLFAEDGQTDFKDEESGEPVFINQLLGSLHFALKALLDGLRLSAPSSLDIG
jgi:hypothetical protein